MGEETVTLKPAHCALLGLEAPLQPSPSGGPPASAPAPAQTWALHLPGGDAESPAGAFLCPRAPEPQKATADGTQVSPSDAEVH